MKGLWCLFAPAALAVAAAATVGAPQSGVNVVVTTKPVHSLVAQLMEGVGTPDLLVKGSASPHTFSLKPSDVRAINAADLFIRVGEDVEPFTRKIVKTLPDSVRVVTLETVPGVKLLDRRARGTFETHHHERAAPAKGARLGDKDGHMWLDPDNAKAIVSYLAEALSARAPTQAAKLKANAQRLNAKIDALTAGIAAQMQPLRDKPFVVFHDAFQYFETRFGLHAVGAITASPEMRPSAKRLTELRGQIRAGGAVCVFTEPLYQPNLVGAVLEGTNVRSGTLDPVGTTLEPGPDLYFQLMRNLASGFQSCLGRPS